MTRPAIRFKPGYRAEPAAGPWTEREVAVLREQLAEGAPSLEIARRLGRTRDAVWKKAAALGIAIAKAAPAAGWTAEDDRTLARLRAQGRTAREIGEALKRSATAVQQRCVVLRMAAPARRVSADELPETHPLMRALAVLMGQGWSCQQQVLASRSAGTPAMWSLRPPRRLVDMRGVVASANALLAERGQAAIPYPQLPGATPTPGSARAGDTARRPQRRDVMRPGVTSPAAAVGLHEPPPGLSGGD